MGGLIPPATFAGRVIPEFKYGLLGGVAVCLWIALEYALGLHTTRPQLGEYTGLLSNVIPLVMLYLLLQKKRAAIYDGRLSLGAGIWSSVLACFAASLLVYSFLSGYTHFLNPTWIDQALELKVTAWRATDQTTADAMVTARAGNGRSLGEVKLSFAAQEKRASASFELPVELRNDMQRLEINNERNAAATYLFDDRWRRKTVALQSGAAFETAQPLLSPLYYVSRALEPFAELTEPGDTAALKRALDSGLSMLVLADIGVIPEENQRLIEDWVKNGGMLLRFAGPRLAGATPEQDDPLLPARLREGGRSLGSALIGPSTGYGAVYYLEIILLFGALIAIGPLARYAPADDDSKQSTKFGLAQMPV